MKNKSRGSTAERDLVHQLWAEGWAACRAAGSGSMRYPSPDIVASKNGEHYAIECKLTRNKCKYLNKQEIQDLETYSKIAGVEAIIAIKFPKEKWLFISPKELEENQKSYSVTVERAKQIGRNQL